MLTFLDRLLPYMTRLSKRVDLAAPIFVLIVMVVMILPLPAFVHRHPDRFQHHHVPGHPHGGHVRRPAPGIQRLPLHPADDHPVPPGAERGHHPPDPALRRRAGARGGRAHGPGLRPVRGGRQLHHRPGGVPDPPGDPVHRHQPRLRAHRRSDRPLHPGRHARQADGHRRRPQRRLHRRDRGPPAAQGPGRRSQLLRGHGRRREVHPAGRRGRPDHPGGQHHRRHHHRHRQVQPAGASRPWRPSPC